MQMSSQSPVRSSEGIPCIYRVEVGVKRRGNWRVSCKKKISWVMPHQLQNAYMCGVDLYGAPLNKFRDIEIHF